MLAARLAPRPASRLPIALLALLVVPFTSAQEGDPRPWSDGAYNWFGHTPIRVHLEDSNLTEESSGFLESVRAALRYWERGGNGRAAWEIRFVEVDTRAEADIVLWFRGAGPEALCGDDPRSVGCARPFDRPVPIEILTRTGDGSFVAYQRVREVTEHEIGHAIGFPHSDIRGDIMAPHVSRRSGASYAPGDWRSLVGGLALLVGVLAVLTFVLWRVLRPIRDVFRLPEGPAAPCRPFRRHAFVPMEVDAGGRWESYFVCRRCHGGYPASDESPDAR